MRRKVVEWLIWQLEHEVDDQHFNMELWLSRVSDKEGIVYEGEQSIPYCKTAGCIAGTLFLRLPKKIRKLWAAQDLHERDYDPLPQYVAKIQLGATDEEAETLFAPSEVLKNIKREHAIAVLKGILKTSHIDWPAVLPRGLQRDLFSYARKPLCVRLTED
jgi:hypothetical protein